MQTIQFKTAKLFAALMLLLVALTGCEKDEPSQPNPQPVPQPAARELTVGFTNSSIPFSDIDSIVVIVRDQQHFIKEFKKMQKGTSWFRLNLQHLPAGSYYAELAAYSKKGADFTARQYALTKNMVLPLQQQLVVSAPTGSFSDVWFQRAVFSEGQDNALIIVAMDPRDSYYEVRLRLPVARQVHLQRHSIDVNAVVASKSSSRDVRGLIEFGEYSDYLPYVQAMAGKTWTKGVLNGWIDQEGLGDVGFYYEYYYH